MGLKWITDTFSPNINYINDDYNKTSLAKTTESATFNSINVKKETEDSRIS